MTAPRDRVSVFAPATVANVASGFDVLGFALDTPGDSVTLLRSSEKGVRVTSITGDQGRLPHDWNTTRVRKVSADGTINTVIGNGTPGYSGDGGPAAVAQIGAPWGLAFDIEGNLYISDDIPGDDYGPDATHIRKVSPDQTITTVAGIGALGYSGDRGPATAAQLDAAGPLAVDSSGNLYFAGESRIRKISPDGIISTIAGGERAAYSGDGGPAASAEVSWSPHGVGLALATDGGGNLYIADTGNYRIRRISPDGMIDTVAGNGTCCYSGDSGLAK